MIIMDFLSWYYWKVMSYIITDAEINSLVSFLDLRLPISEGLMISSFFSSIIKTAAKLLIYWPFRHLKNSCGRLLIELQQNNMASNCTAKYFFRQIFQTFVSDCTT